MTLRSLAALTAGLILFGAQGAQAQTPAPPPLSDTGRDHLITYLTGLASRATADRRAVIAGLSTAEEAHHRQVRVRSLLSEMIVFETAVGPVEVRSAGVVQDDGFDIERMRYESLPGYWVTADVYTPATPGPHPAIIVQPGHGSDGKVGNFNFAANFARAGFVVLAIDIVGHGERVQHFDPEIGASRVGRPTGEHSMAFGQALPTGGHVSRYFIQDAMRGVDYLMARSDVDDQRIGAFGCSGGGTITAYLAALDRRIKATATACYITDYDHLLAPGGPGPQDAEQSIPYFLDRGLDLADWVEAAAPRPYAIVSTTEDMFPVDGARAAYAEARRFYGLMEASDRITMIEGPGAHGNLGPIAPQIVAFFTRWLMDAPAERPFATVPLRDARRLWATPTGQLSTSADGGEPLRTLIRAEADEERPAPIPGETQAQALARLRVAIGDITGRSVRPGDAPPAVTEHAGTGNLTPITFEAAPGLEVRGSLSRGDGRGRRPTLLLLASTANPATITAWTAAGWNVLWLEPRGAGGTEEAKSPLTGDWTLLSLRALLVGKTPVGMRMDDATATMNWLATRDDVDMDRIVVAGIGALGPVALHVAVLDDRIGQVTVENAITDYRQFVDRPVSRDMAEVNLPGVLRRYDLPDLMAALGDRLTLVNPVTSVGQVMTVDEVHAVSPGVSNIVFRGTRDPVTPPAAR